MDTITMTAEQLINTKIPEKCSCCPHMFEYKCRADKCPYEENRVTQNE